MNSSSLNLFKPILIFMAHKRSDTVGLEGCFRLGHRGYSGLPVGFAATLLNFETYLTYHYLQSKVLAGHFAIIAG